MAKFVRAYESGDVDALVALLTADVSVSMPPVSLEYQGREVDRIAAMTRFDNNVLPGSGCHDRSPADHHGLPQSTVVQPEDHQQNGDLKAGKVVENYFSKLPDPADHPVFALTPAASHWVRQQQWG